MPGTLLFTMGLAFFLGSVATPEKVVRLYAMKDMPTIRRAAPTMSTTSSEQVIFTSFTRMLKPR